MSQEQPITEIMPQQNNEVQSTDSKDEAFLSAHDKATLDKSIALRMQMVDDLFKDGSPKDNRDRRMANELLTAVDASIHKKAESRLKFTDTKNNAGLVDVAVATLKALRSGVVDINSPIAGYLPQSPVIEAELIDIKTVPDELAINPEQLEIEEFVRLTSGRDE